MFGVSARKYANIYIYGGGGDDDDDDDELSFKRC